jgi:hypothetical protein
MGENQDHIPALVFSGAYSEALFLKSLLEASGIETSLETSMGSRAGGPPRLFVRHGDLQHAQEVVTDFMQKGKRTSP